MKRIVFIITLIFAATFVQAQVNEVTLMVNGEGTTKNEATALALRSAIEQAFGTFVSANTEILNDEIIKDEIATVASGNIKSYNEISSVKTDDGYNVSLQVVVSVGKLIEYSKSHGSSAEFAGKTFAMQMKLEQLNIDNEKKALHDMIRQLYLLLPDVFDYSIEVGNPVMISTEECTIDCVVSLNTNANSKSFYDVIKKYLQGLSVDKDLNTPNKYRVLFDDKEYYLRTNEWLLDMNCLLKRGLFPKILDFEVLGKTGENKQKFYFCESFHYYGNISSMGRLPDKHDYGWFSFHFYEFLNKIDGTSVEQMDNDRYNNRILRIGSQHLHYARIFPEEPNKAPAIYIDDDKMRSIYLFPFVNPYNNKTIYHVELQLKLKNTVLENLEEIVVQPPKYRSDIVKPALINEDNISDPSPLPNKSTDLTYDVLFKLFRKKYYDYRRYLSISSLGSQYQNCYFQIGIYVHDDGHLSMDKSCLPEFLTSQNTDEIYLWYHDGRFIKKRKIDDADGQMKSWMQYVLTRFEEFISTIRVTPCEINGVVQDKSLIGFGLHYGEFTPFYF